jgi:hypothetical protein
MSSSWLVSDEVVENEKCYEDSLCQRRLLPIVENDKNNSYNNNNNSIAGRNDVNGNHDVIYDHAKTDHHLERNDVLVSSIGDIRSSILHLAALIGILSHDILLHLPWDGSSLPSCKHENEGPHNESHLVRAITKTPSHSVSESAMTLIAIEHSIRPILLQLLNVATLLHIDLPAAIDAKMALNAKKYPVELCKVRVCVCRENERKF